MPFPWRKKKAKGRRWTLASQTEGDNRTVYSHGFLNRIDSQRAFIEDYLLNFSESSFEGQQPAKGSRAAGRESTAADIRIKFKRANIFHSVLDGGGRNGVIAKFRVRWEQALKSLYVESMRKVEQLRKMLEYSEAHRKNSLGVFSNPHQKLYGTILHQGISSFVSRCDKLQVHKQAGNNFL